MHTLVKTTIIGIGFLTGAAIAAHADALSGSAGGAGEPMAAPQIAALPPAASVPGSAPMARSEAGITRCRRVLTRMSPCIPTPAGSARGRDRGPGRSS